MVMGDDLVYKSSHSWWLITLSRHFISEVDNILVKADDLADKSSLSWQLITLSHHLDDDMHAEVKWA